MMADEHLGFCCELLKNKKVSMTAYVVTLCKSIACVLTAAAKGLTAAKQ